jgi:hypothetical protein
LSNYRHLHPKGEACTFRHFYVYQKSIESKGKILAKNMKNRITPGKISFYFPLKRSGGGKNFPPPRLFWRSIMKHVRTQ